ncbi:MAG TPA: hypothetical protein VNX01_06675 [Bacteroidia bacterium]|jgi:hypothetical protein|nr:hypothetical protein [Bacteroidia bacterium]
MKSTTKISYKHGFFFPVGGLIFGGFLLLISLPMIFNPVNFIYFCIGTTIMWVGLLFFSTKGFEINPETKKLRAYTNVLGIKTGKESYLSNFKFITIISQGYSQSISPVITIEVKREFSTCNLLLVNETHHLKQLVQSFNTYEDALEEAKKLSELLNFEIVKYNPVRTRSSRKK